MISAEVDEIVPLVGATRLVVRLETVPLVVVESWIDTMADEEKEDDEADTIMI